MPEQGGSGTPGDRNGRDTARPAAVTGRRVVVLLTLLGAGLALLASTQTWATVTLPGIALPGLSDLVVPGRRAAPAVIAIAAAAVAAAVVLAISGRLVRVFIAVGLLISGAAVLVSGVQAARDKPAAASIAIRDGLGISNDPSADGTSSPFFADDAFQVVFSIWPWVAAGGGGLLLLAGLLTLLGGRSWPGPTQRYERGPGAGGSIRRSAGQGAGYPPPGQPATPASTWDALSRGEDPTSSGWTSDSSSSSSFGSSSDSSGSSSSDSSGSSSSGSSSSP